jgi:hypothetical protein
MGDSFLANNRVDIIYTLQDGKRVSRRFWHMDAACYEALLQLDHTKEFDELLRYTLNLPATINTVFADVGFPTPPKVMPGASIYLRLPDGKCVWPELSEIQQRALLQTLYEELSAQTLQQRYFPETQEAVTLCLPVGDKIVYVGDEIHEVNQYNYFADQQELTLALYPGQFDRTLAILQETGGDLSQNTDFVRAVGISTRVFLQDNVSFYYSPPPAVFYAYTNIIEINPFALEPKITKQQSEITDSSAIARLYQNSTTQTSYAREGYLVWFIRADGSSVCRFAENTEFSDVGDVKAEKID